MLSHKVKIPACSQRNAILPFETFYLAWGGRPFLEETFDINGDGIVPQEYSYPQIFDFYNFRYSTAPYFNNEQLHGIVGQDDWRLDDSGVQYFHIYGEQSRANTVSQIIATPVVRKPLSIFQLDYEIDVKSGFGDKTVPRLSAERIGEFNYNSPDATLSVFVAENSLEDSRYEHTGLIKAPEVIDQIFDYLELAHQTSIYVLGTQKGGKSMPHYEFKANSGLSVEQLRLPAKQSYYATVRGTDRLLITDDLGNTNTPFGDDGFELAVPGVGYRGGIGTDPPTVGYHGLDFPAEEGEYTIKFQTGTDSIDIEVLRGVGSTSPNLAVRYIDLDLPANVECLLTFSPAGVPDLRYDSNGDGTYDVVVPAHIRVSGTAAQDVTPPNVSIGYSKRTSQGRLITVKSSDLGSGVGTVYYRVGESGPYQVYTGTFFLFLPVDKVIEAFADDNVGNRSSPVRIVAPKWNSTTEQ